MISYKDKMLDLARFKVLKTEQSNNSVSTNIYYGNDILEATEYSKTFRSILGGALKIGGSVSVNFGGTYTGTTTLTLIVTANGVEKVNQTFTSDGMASVMVDSSDISINPFDKVTVKFSINGASKYMGNLRAYGYVHDNIQYFLDEN